LNPDFNQIAFHCSENSVGCYSQISAVVQIDSQLNPLVLGRNEDGGTSADLQLLQMRTTLEQ